MSTDCQWTHTYTHTYMYPRVLVSVDGTVTRDVHGPSMDTHLYPHIHVPSCPSIRGWHSNWGCQWTHTYTPTHMYPRVLVSVDGTVTGDVHGLSMDTHLYPHIHVPSCPSIRGWHSNWGCPRTVHGHTPIPTHTCTLVS